MICKKCNMRGNFSWDNEWFKKTGKWRLIDNEQNQPHVCVKKKKTRIQWESLHNEPNHQEPLDEPNYQESLVFITREQYEEAQERTKSLRSRRLYNDNLNRVR